MIDKFSWQKGNRARSVFRILNILFMLLLIVAMLVPVMKVLADSLDAKGTIELRLIPSKPTLAAYEIIASTVSLYRPFLISIFVTVVGTLTALIVTSLGAYVLAQRNLPGRTAFTYLILFSMIFHGGMIPTYMVVRSLHLLDTLYAVILPVCCNTYFLILLKNFFGTIPVSLMESAEIDGCTPMGILFRIVLPLSKAGLAAIGLFYAVYFWNSFFPYILYINNSDLYNFQVKLRELILLDAQVDPGAFQNIYIRTLQNAAIVVSIVPVAILYPFLQKHFVKGVNLGAIKG
jgi:putative aldouronate transport system permease protein